MTNKGYTPEEIQQVISLRKVATPGHWRTNMVAGYNERRGTRLDACEYFTDKDGNPDMGFAPILSHDWDHGSVWNNPADPKCIAEMMNHAVPMMRQLQRQLAERDAEINKMDAIVKALQFYADEGNWEWQDEDTPFSSPVLNDEGKLARQTLRECGIEPSAPRS